MLIVTHSGKFHADDVFAVALLKELYPEAEVLRSRKPEDFTRGDIVVDVGMVYDPSTGRLDHHQKDGAGARENGIKYAGFGLAWKHYGLEYCGSNDLVWQKVDEKLVAPIDADDNGQKVYEVNDFDTNPFTVPNMISVLNPGFDEEDVDRDELFTEAVEIATKILRRVVKRITASVLADDLVREAYRNSPSPEYLVLDKYLPLGKVTEEMPELLYTVYPGTSDEWIVHTVEVPDQQFVAKKLFPENWWGKDAAALSTETGIADARFCHGAGWIAGANTKEAAIKMLELALAN